MFVGGTRFAIRSFRPRDILPAERREQPRQRVLIVGAGDAGEMLVREIQTRHASRYRPVGFLDDDVRKQGAQIHGVRVVGRIDDLPQVVAAREIDEVVIAMPSANGQQMRRVVDLCKSAEVRFKTIPGIDHLIDGRVTVNQLRNVAIEDLSARRGQPAWRRSRRDGAR
jgi:FlaA1/EpsC-like NDP-sugar epimerase